MSTGTQPGYSPAGFQAPRAPSVHTGLAVTSFILAFFVPVVPFILGWVDVAAAHKAGRRASGLAVAAMAVSALLLVLVVAVAVVAASAATSQADQTQQWLNCLNQQLNNPALVCTPPGS